MLSSRLKFIFDQIYKVWFLWLLCLAANIITFLYIFYKIKPGGQVLALQYNVLVGPTSFGQGNSLYLIPAIAFAVTAVNYIIYRSIKRRSEFLPALAVAVSLFVQLVLLFAVIYLAAVTQ